MNIVLLGAPGAGKGTQAARLVQEYQLAHISTGDLLRAAVQAATPLGMEAKAFMDAGELVPDSLVINLIKERLREPDAASGFILDGFPRNTNQAVALQGELADLELKIDTALAILVDPEALIQRLSSRRCCRECGHIGSTADTSCPLCDSQMYQRDDDQPEAIRNRLEVYERLTAPLIDYYRGAELLSEIDGSQSAEEVYASIQQAIA
jgi:adenylate kinase